MHAVCVCDLSLGVSTSAVRCLLAHQYLKTGFQIVTKGPISVWSIELFGVLLSINLHYTYAVRWPVKRMAIRLLKLKSPVRFMPNQVRKKPRFSTCVAVVGIVC